jgi:hypothetical protein
MAQPGTAWNFPSVGRFGVTALPSGWMFVAGFGIRQVVMDPRFVVCNISLMEDTLPEDKTLTEYIQAQCKMINERHKEVKLAGPQPATFPGSEEALMLLVRHKVKDVIDMLHVQNYVRVGQWIGIVTLTSPEQQLRAVRPDHDAFVKGLHILPPPPPPEPAPGMAQGQTH